MAIGKALKTVGLFFLAGIAVDLVAQTGLTNALAKILKRGMRAFGELLWKAISGELGMAMPEAARLIGG